MKKLSTLFHNFTNLTLLIISTVTLIGFMIFVLPKQAEKSKAYAGETGSVDLSFILSADKIYEMAEEYGENGREQYIRARLTFDSIFPLVFGFFLVIGSSFFLAKGFNKNSWFYYLNVIPFFGVLFDYFENFSISYVMFRFPEKSEFVTSLVILFTPLKWILVTLGFVLILIGAIKWLFISINRKSYE